MRFKATSLHPLLVLLAVAMASVLFVAACGGGGEATTAPEVMEETMATDEGEAAEEDLAELGQGVVIEGSLEEEEIAELGEGVVVAEEAETAMASEEGAPRRGGTLTVGIVADHVSLDPPWNASVVDIGLTQSLYDNLLMIQPDLSVKPELATSWEANGDLSSYTFHLRKGVKFHHGKDFKAEDVLFTFNRLLDPVLDSPARSTFETIKDMTIIDDYTIRFDLTGPNAFFPESTSIYQARILPADVDVDRLTLEEFGTGPFKILEHEPGIRTTMVRNEDYWEEGKPYLDEMIYLNIKEAATRAEALKNGDVDVVYQLEPQSVADIEAHPDTTVIKAASLSWIGMDMDNRVPPFDNILVRKAMQAVTDRDFLRQAAMLGLGANAYHQIPPNDVRFAPQYAPPEYNVELAKSLLAEAGYPDGIDITLFTSDVGAGMIEMAVAYKELAEPAGIRVEIQRTSPDGYWDAVWTVEPFTMVFWFGRANPDQALSIQLLSTSSWNAPRYNNPVFDDLVIRARGEKLEQQKETYAEIQRILIDEVPQIIVAFQPWLYGARNNLRGVEPHPLGWGLFQDGWFVADES